LKSARTIPRRSSKTGSGNCLRKGKKSDARPPESSPLNHRSATGPQGSTGYHVFRMVWLQNLGEVASASVKAGAGVVLPKTVLFEGSRFLLRRSWNGVPYHPWVNHPWVIDVCYDRPALGGGRVSSRSEGEVIQSFRRFLGKPGNHTPKSPCRSLPRETSTFRLAGGGTHQQFPCPRGGSRCRRRSAGGTFAFSGRLSCDPPGGFC